jgi:hypothetical protein
MVQRDKEIDNYISGIKGIKNVASRFSDWSSYTNSHALHLGQKAGRSAALPAGGIGDAPIQRRLSES